MNKSRALIANVVTPLLITGVMILGDAFVFLWRPAGIPDVYWALLDSPVHMVLALLVASPLFFHPDLRRRPFRWILIAGLVATLLDLDHVVAAGSFALHDILTLDNRPMSHSLLFAIGCAYLAYLLSGRLVIGWLIFTVLASHVLRDTATGNTPLLWPLSRSIHIPGPLYYAAELGLYAAARIFVRITAPAANKHHSFS